MCRQPNTKDWKGYKVVTLFGPEGPTDVYMRWARSSSDSEPTARTVQVHADGLNDEMRKPTEGWVVVASDVALRAAKSAPDLMASHGSRYVRMPATLVRIPQTRCEADELTFGMMTFSFPSTMP